jgi:hypothetical protein
VAEVFLSTTEYGGHSISWQNHGFLPPSSLRERSIGIAATTCAQRKP